MFGHDPFEGLDAVHARHLDIHGHDIRFELMHELQRLFAVARHADDRNAGILRQHRREALPHKCRIVDNQYLNRFDHTRQFLLEHVTRTALLEAATTRLNDVLHQFFREHFRIELRDIIRGADLAAFVLITGSRQRGM